jgi:hypothetical protein
LDADINLHARNLKLISIAFILYWLLGLEQTGDAIRLGILPYKITNPEWLPYLAHLLFFYFIWRYWLNTKSRVAIYLYMRNLQVFDQNSLNSFGITDAEYRKFQKTAQALYKKRNVNEESDAIAHNLILADKRTAKINFSFDPPKLRDPNNPLSGQVGDTLDLFWFDLFRFRFKLILSRLWSRESEQDRIITWLLALIGLFFSIINNCGKIFEKISKCLEYIS